MTSHGISWLATHMCRSSVAQIPQKPDEREGIFASLYSPLVGQLEPSSCSSLHDVTCLGMSSLRSRRLKRRQPSDRANLCGRWKANIDGAT